MIGIIGAMEVEVENIKNLLSNRNETKISGINFVTGEYNEKEVVVAKCGVGKVFASFCTEAMILTFKPEIIINTGVAGSLDTDLKIGDIVIADSVCQHDMDTSSLGDPKGMISDLNIIKIPADKDTCKVMADSVKRCGLNYRVGTIASGDQFVSDSRTKEYIAETFGAKACEMEGAAVGHVCYVNGIPFAVLRSMSDGADDGAMMDFAEFTKIAAANSANVIKEFLKIR